MAKLMVKKMSQVWLLVSKFDEKTWHLGLAERAELLWRKGTINHSQFYAVVEACNSEHFKRVAEQDYSLPGLWNFTPAGNAARARWALEQAKSSR